jgi:hypothetical protein
MTAEVMKTRFDLACSQSIERLRTDDVQHLRVDHAIREEITSNCCLWKVDGCVKKHQVLQVRDILVQRCVRSSTFKNWKTSFGLESMYAGDVDALRTEITMQSWRVSRP